MLSTGNSGRSRTGQVHARRACFKFSDLSLNGMDLTPAAIGGNLLRNGGVVMTERHTGGCLCGAVRYSIAGKPGPVVGCHCSQCRRQTGFYYAAANVPRGALSVEGAEAVRWYRSSGEAQRGFCGNCGSALFWQGDESLEGVRSWPEASTSRPAFPSVTTFTALTRAISTRLRMACRNMTGFRSSFWLKARR